MKKNKWNELYEKNSDAEQMIAFFTLCGDDMAFFEAPRRKRQPQDYVRLMCIARILGFPSVFMKLLADGENKLDSILAEFGRVRNNLSILSQWMEKFIAGIPDNSIRRMAETFWQDKVSRLSARDFTLTDVF